MIVHILVFLLLAHLASCSTGSIIITKITSHYWHATFSSSPLNIETKGFLLDFYALIDKISHDPDVKVIVFDSTVKDFWIAHFDILNVIPTNLTSDNGAYWGNITRLANLPVPTVAAIRGIANGGGAEIAAALDVSFVSDKASFTQFEVGTGVVPGGGGLALLPARVGRNRALEIVLGADTFDAKTAADYGCGDHYGLAAAKKLINKNAGFPTTEQWLGTWDAFLEGASKPAFAARYLQLLAAGFETNVSFEKNIAAELLRFVNGTA